MLSSRTNLKLGTKRTQLVKSSTPPEIWLPSTALNKWNSSGRSTEMNVEMWTGLRSGWFYTDGTHYDNNQLVNCEASRKRKKRETRGILANNRTLSHDGGRTGNQSQRVIQIMGQGLHQELHQVPHGLRRRRRKAEDESEQQQLEALADFIKPQIDESFEENRIEEEDAKAFVVGHLESELETLIKTSDSDDEDEKEVYKAVKEQLKDEMENVNDMTASSSEADTSDCEGSMWGPLCGSMVLGSTPPTEYWFTHGFGQQLSTQPELSLDFCTIPKRFVCEVLPPQISSMDEKQAGVERQVKTGNLRVLNKLIKHASP